MSQQDLATSATLAADPNATLAAPPSISATTTTTINTSLRTTVLPRVELVGEQPHVVADGKVRYELSRRLGEGGVGEVVMARDNDIDRDVAIKRLRPELQGSHSTVLRFAEEVRTVGKLEHPNIVPIHDVGIHENGEYFFVMKYVQGETLETIIEKLAAGDHEYHARYPIERRVQIMMGILDAIAYAHAQEDHPPRHQARERDGGPVRRGHGDGLGSRARGARKGARSAGGVAVDRRTRAADAGSIRRRSARSSARPRTCRPSKRAATSSTSGATSTASA